MLAGFVVLVVLELLPVATASELSLSGGRSGILSYIVSWRGSSLSYEMDERGKTEINLSNSPDYGHSKYYSQYRKVFTAFFSLF